LDRKFRKQIKSDRFVEDVKGTFDWLGEHKTAVTRYGAIALAVVLVGAGIYFFMHYQAGRREDALAQAMRIDNATVGAAQPPPGGLSYPTQEEKDKARAKVFGDLVAKDHGTQEGAIAEMYLASDAADKGDLAAAEKMYKDVMDSAPDAYASLARMSLAKVESAQGKQADAEKLLRDAVAHPSVTVSKEEAIIQLALLIAKDKPEEARKLLEPLRTEPRAAVSRAALTALGEIASLNK
jgi:predicted negative regulator of RcsB-dependent stress response